MAVHGRTRRKQDVALTGLVIPRSLDTEVTPCPSSVSLIAAALRCRRSRRGDSTRPAHFSSANGPIDRCESPICADLGCIPRFTFILPTQRTADVRLLPEPAAPPETASALAEPRTPSLNTYFTVAPPSTGPLAQNAIPLRDTSPGRASSDFSATTNVKPPLAKLRREAPRPIGNEPRSPATIRRNPQPVLPSRRDRSGSRRCIPSYSREPMPVLPAGYSAGGDVYAPQPAALQGPLQLPEPQGLGPPPWSASDELEGPRTHVVIDGDSLEKLAGRYLDDPRRAAEIYELNRELLANPAGSAADWHRAQNPGSSHSRQLGSAGPIARITRTISPSAPPRRGNLVPIRSTNLDEPVIHKPG